MQQLLNQSLLLIRRCLMLAALLFTLSSQAEAPRAIYDKAAALYKQNQFEQAAAAYEQLITTGHATAEVYFNLGNCYYKLNKAGKAILNYERAHNLAPADEDIALNLRIANSRLLDKVQPVPQLGIVKACGDFISSRSCTGWRAAAIAFVWLAILLLAISLFMSTFKPVIRTLGLVLLAVSLLSAWFGHVQADKVSDSCRGVLLTESTYAKSSPDAAGNNSFLIHEGITFQLLDKVGAWSKIRLADGKIGWIEAGNFEKI